MNDVRCPFCRKKLGDTVLGYYRTTCPRCHAPVVIVRAGALNVNDGGTMVSVRVETRPA